MSDEPFRARRLRVVNAARRTDSVWLFTFDAAEGSTLDDLDFEPGQVAVLAIPSVGEAYMAIASPPSAHGILEFLVKRSGEVGERLCDLGHDADVQLVGLFGRGFPVDSYGGGDLVFVASGTAIAPVRSAISHAVDHRTSFGRIVLVHGVRHPTDFAVDDELDLWRASGVDVSLTVTRPERTDWRGNVGRVQSLLENAIRTTDDPVVFVVGSDEMMSETATTLAALGVPPERVHRNY
jgi:NAD(P)H-flavin reductase